MGEVSVRLHACTGRGKPSRCLGLRRGPGGAAARGGQSSAPALEVALVYPLKEFLLNVTIRVLILIPKYFLHVVILLLFLITVMRESGIFNQS